MGNTKLTFLSFSTKLWNGRHNVIYAWFLLSKQSSIPTEVVPHSQPTASQLQEWLKMHMYGQYETILQYDGSYEISLRYYAKAFDAARLVNNTFQ